MTLRIVRNDNLFRIESKDISTNWISDTPENRKAMIVFLRLLLDSNGRPLFTHQQLAEIVKSSNRQAASNHYESFVACGCDFLSFLTRKRKVNEEVCSAVLSTLMEDRLALVSEVAQKVNVILNRADISEMNIQSALESISFKEVRGTIQKRLAKGEAHYKEQYLLDEMMRTFSSEGGDASSRRDEAWKKKGITIPEMEGMPLSDPTAIRSLLTPQASLSNIKHPLQWVCFIMALYYHGLPLSVLGRWFNVHKTTILRWIISLTLCLWPLVYSWINKRVKAKVVYIDEKWLKIKGKWHYWFVVLDSDTGLPVIASLLYNKSKWSFSWIGTLLKQLKKVPRIFITDGMLGYDYIQEAIGQRVHRILCHFHHQQGITHYLRDRFKEEEIPQRKKEMKKILQTDDKRTVRRRFEKLKSIAKKLCIEKWVTETERKLPKLLPAVGSKKIEKTNNAIERFFRAFNRFYKIRCGFFSIISAKRELIFFMLMYLFIKQPQTGKAPLESIMPEVKDMPFYLLLNDPIVLLMNNENVNIKYKMADFNTKELIAMQI